MQREFKKKKRVLEGELHAPPERIGSVCRRWYTDKRPRIRFNFEFRSTHSSSWNAVLQLKGGEGKERNGKNYINEEESGSRMKFRQIVSYRRTIGRYFFSSSLNLMTLNSTDIIIIRWRGTRVPRNGKTSLASEKTKERERNVCSWKKFFRNRSSLSTLSTHTFRIQLYLALRGLDSFTLRKNWP